MTCTRCEAKSKAMLDYCAECGKTLCTKCMYDGCCGMAPAMSGAELESEEEDWDDED